MSWENVLPSNLVPIKDVKEDEVERAGRFAVEEHNSSGGHHFVYKRVVNGLYGPIISWDRRYFIIVIEAINDHGFHWSYIAKVKRFRTWPPLNNHGLLSFEEVIEFPVPK